MLRFLLTTALVAAVAVGAGVWLSGRLRESRRQQAAEFEQRVEHALDQMISLEELAGGDQTLEDVLRHIARQAELPLVINRTRFQDEPRAIWEKPEIYVPDCKLSLRSALNLLSHQTPMGYYADGARLVITTEVDAASRPTSRIYPLPPLAGPEQSWGTDEEEWTSIVTQVIDPDSWDDVGGPAEVIPLPGALLIRQSQCGHEHLQQFFRRLQNIPATPDAHADYLASYSPAEQRILAVLEAPCDFQCTAKPLHEVMEEISWQHHIPLVIRQSKLEESAIDLKTPLSVSMKGTTLRSMLRTLLDQANLSYGVCDDVLQVTTPEDIGENPRLMVYDVRDLVANPSGWVLRPRIYPTYGSRERVAMPASLDFDSLEHLLEVTIQPDSWSDGNQQIFADIPPGLIAFWQTDNIHSETADLITHLRATLLERPGGSHVPLRQTPAEQNLDAALAHTERLEYHAAPLQDVVSDLAKRTGCNVRVDGRKLEECGLQSDTVLTCDLPPLPLRTALGRMLVEDKFSKCGLGWCVQNESLVLTALHNYLQSEICIVDVRSLVAPQDDENAFTLDNLTELVKAFVETQDWDGTARMSTFESLLVLSAPREVNERVQQLVAGLTQFRDQALVARKQGKRNIAPVPIAGGDADEGLSLRAYPLEDLLGTDGPSALDDLGNVITHTVLEDTWNPGGGPGDMMPVPPGALLVSQTPKGHEQVQRFLDQMRQHLVPNQPLPAWLAQRDKQRQELAQFLSSREQILPAKRMSELAGNLQQIVGQKVGLGEAYLDYAYQDVPRPRTPRDPDNPQTVQEQLAGLGLALVASERGLDLGLAEEDVRLGFYDVSDLLAGKDKFEVDELSALLDGGMDFFAPAWEKLAYQFAPVSFRGWIVIRGSHDRLKVWEQLLAWLREQPELTRAEQVQRDWGRAKTRPLIDRLISSQSLPERLYLAFLLQFAPLPQDSYDDLAALAESLASGQDPVLSMRLKDVLHRWVVAESRPAQEALFDTTYSSLLRKAAMRALAARIGGERDRHFTDAIGLQVRISDRQDLSANEVAELKVALTLRQPPQIYHTDFENRLFSEERVGGPSPWRLIPPWRRPESQRRPLFTSPIPVVG